MTTSIPDISTFLLIDNGMLAAGDGITIAADERASWLACVYEDSAATVSPYVIDIDAAYQEGQMDRAMALVNTKTAKLHVSFIDTGLSLAELVEHLRHFIMVRCDGDKNLTLRFADGAVLPNLATAFAPEQWAALAWPMARWQVHGYDGNLFTLPSADAAVTRLGTPLLLTQEQLTSLDRTMLPNRVLANLRAMRHGEDFPGSVADQHRWASASVRLWRDVGNAHDIVLRWLTSAALDTQGAVFEQEHINSLLKKSDLDAIRTGLRDLVVAHRARFNLTGKHL